MNFNWICPVRGKRTGWHSNCKSGKMPHPNNGLAKFIFFLGLHSFALQLKPAIGQTTIAKFALNSIVVEQDTFPMIFLPAARVVEKGNNPAKTVSYYKMKRDIRAVMPYVLVASEKYKEINARLPDFEKKRHKRKYLKKEESAIFDQFEKEVKELTVTQGRILIKLIYRETGVTTYDLVKEYRGGVNAAFWQGMAHLWGSSLKDDYQPNGRDAMMEQIIHELNGESKKIKK